MEDLIARSVEEIGYDGEKGFVLFIDKNEIIQRKSNKIFNFCLYI